MSAPTSPIFRAEAVLRHRAGRAVEQPIRRASAGRLGWIWLVLGALLVGSAIATGGRAMDALLSPLIHIGVSLPVLLAVVGALMAVTVAAMTWVRCRRGMPVLLQMNSVECGAACLAMVLSHFGRVTRVAECTDKLGAGRDGLTARALVDTARRYGMDVRALSLSPADLAHLTGPVIAHWEFNHFLVVTRWSAEGVEVVDPAYGRRRLTSEEFAAGFTGVAIVCTPGAGFEPSPARAYPWRGHIRPFLVCHAGLISQILAASLLLQGFGLVVPLLSKVIVDDVLPHRDRNLLTVLALGLAVVVLSQGLLQYLRAIVVVVLRERLDVRLVPSLMDRLFRLPYRFFEQRRAGDLIARIGSLSTLRDALTAQAISTVLDGALAVGYLVLVLGQDLAMGIAVLALGLVQVVLIERAGARERDLTRRELMADAAAQSYLVEALTGVATVKASGAEERALQHWSKLFRTHLQVGVLRGQHAALVEAVLAVPRGLAVLLPLWLGASRVLDGGMSLGSMLATTALATAALMPLSSLVTSVQRLQGLSAHVDRLADIVFAIPEQDPARFLQTPRLSGRIEVDKVHFRYDPHSPLALTEVSVTIVPGQKVAIVGRSGSGKSTLGKVLLGLHPPSEGTVRYDGLAIQDLELRSLRRQFGVVMQDPALFSGSIRDNLAFVEPSAELARVEEAAQLAAIHEDIVAMPMGYETLLSEGGAGLSGGQRQRLALGRAVLHRPSVLLLDEATSHLDVATEAAVERNLAQLASTRIVIAHRLSTVRDADLILVMDGGRIVERGTHQELLALGGHYAELAALQGYAAGTGR